MSTDPTTDGIDDPDLPTGIASEPVVLDEDAVATGAAADSSDLPDSIKGLPRLLRYTVLADDNDAHVAERLVAEIEELCPGLASNATWLASRGGDFDTDLGTEAGLVLAAELDRRAAAEDMPDLRSLADCVRLLCLPMPHQDGGAHFAEHRRRGAPD